MMFPYGYYYGRPGLWFLSPFIPAVIILIVLLVFFSLGRSRRWDHFERKYGADPETPLDILKKRYAKGKIDKKQFEEMKRDLE